MSLRIVGPDVPALQALAALLEEHPEWGAVLERIPRDEYRSRLTRSLSASECPDQALFIPGHLTLYQQAQAGRLAPLDGLMLDTPAALVAGYRREEILPGVAAESRVKGRPYMLPVFAEGQILFYRPDLIAVEEDGTVPLIRPQDLGALAAWCSRSCGVAPLGLTAGPLEILPDWLPFLWAEGGDLLDAYGHPAFAGPAGVRALETYCGLRRFCPPDVARWSGDEAAAALVEGRVALAPVWSGQAARVGADPRYRQAVYPQPYSTTWGVAIPANQALERQMEALGVLLQALGPGLDREVSRLAGCPVRRPSYGAEELERRPWLAAQLEMLTRSNTLPADSRVAGLAGALSVAIYRAFVGEVSPAEALESVLLRVSSVG